ncbi:HNH endonuclease [Micromonospora taraxaci]|uniref:HNH endonuclease n=1 Tax=Micromonospora taraxaci TaxID=1316803 RepID=UPI00340AD163
MTAAATRYAAAAADAHLHTLTDLQDQPADIDDRAELRRAYSESLVRSTTGRIYYEELLASAPRNRCPFCGHRDVATLDHQLPKASYPLLAITPDNLVPACWDCNHRKNDAVPTTAATQTLHPYFESAEGSRWLFARVVSLDPAAVIFFADPGPIFSETMRARISHQFNQFRLAALYGTQAARQMAGERRLLANLRQEGGPPAVVKHLRDVAGSWAASSLNCWQHAMYEALAADPGYVGHGHGP